MIRGYKIGAKPRFLLAVGSKEYSQGTLELGTQVAQAFEAELSVIYVGEKVRGISEAEMLITRAALAKWEIYHPGVEVLQWAYQELLRHGCLDVPQDVEVFSAEDLAYEQGHFKVVVPCRKGRKVTLLLREGEILHELQRECRHGEYTLTIIGGSQKRQLAPELVYFLPTSVFVIQNFDPRKRYRLLLCVDDSPHTPKAVQFGALIAAHQGYEVDLLTVSKTGEFRQGYRRAAANAHRLLERKGIPHRQFFETGEPVEVFLRMAGQDHILVMGASTQNPLMKIFKSSRPLEVVKRSQGPVLVVR